MCPQPQHYLQPSQEDVTPGTELKSEFEDNGQTNIAENIIWKRC
jgi:hypothetical protein